MIRRERETDLMMRGEGDNCDDEKRERGRSEDERSAHSSQEAIVMMRRERETDLKMRGVRGNCDGKKRERGRF
jgi:hypothetical protein